MRGTVIPNTARLIEISGHAASSRSSPASPATSWTAATDR
jgi:hypothetical protein